MAYRTLMAFLQAGADNEDTLSVTASLVERFGAHVIGISACQPCNPMYEEGFAAVNVVTEDRTEIRKELEAVAEQFNGAMKGRASSMEWRSAVTYGAISDYVAEQARSVDLVVVGKPTGGSLFDRSRCINVGSLIMQAGRPVLLIPQGLTSRALNHVIASYKDAREARRAISDALPLLQAAANITILQICKSGQQTLAQLEVQDVSEWLKRQGVAAVTAVVETDGSEIESFETELSRRGCDLLIAGAFGHNRLNEWIFGGLTQDVLLDPDCCVLLSH